jgi:methylenetetrahydrofolate dehydrogenase (NADP+)/methenyltetrahydrofolate cyclohydrolase
MILLDGKKLAEKILSELKEEIARLGKKPRLAVVSVGENAASQKFIEQKKKKAEEIGVEVNISYFSAGISESDLKENISRLAADNSVDGLIIQLPLPEKFNMQEILDMIPPEKDLDLLSSASWANFIVGSFSILPPVAGAIKAIFEEYGIDYKHAYTVVVGNGKLVGKPVAAWLKNEGATFAVIDENTENISGVIQSGDIVITGVGKPNLITAEMIKDGAVVIDAGTSESGGKVVGDVDFGSVAPQASYITPVPGGVGPLTVAMLFKNLVALTKK